MKKRVEVGGRLGRTTKSGQKFHCATQRLEKLCRADYNCLLRLRDMGNCFSGAEVRALRLCGMRPQEESPCGKRATSARATSTSLEKKSFSSDFPFPFVSLTFKKNKKKLSALRRRQASHCRFVLRVSVLFLLPLATSAALRRLPRRQSGRLLPATASHHRRFHSRPRPRPRRVRRHAPRQRARHWAERRGQDHRQAPHRRDYAGRRGARAERGRGNAEGGRASPHRLPKVLPRGREGRAPCDGER